LLKVIFQTGSGVKSSPRWWLPPMIIGMPHHTYLFHWDGGLANYLSRLTLNLSPLIFTSQLAGITGGSHHALNSLFKHPPVL
jgi:hypothetical protein